MKRPAPKFSIALLAFVACAVFPALLLLRPVASKAVEAFVPVADGTDSAARAASIEKKAATFRGISFNYDSSLASEITGEVEAESPDGKPGDVWPEHVAFKFQNSYAGSNRQTFFLPEIHIYPVAGYGRTFTSYRIAGTSGRVVDNHARRDLADQIRTLKTLLFARPTSPRRLQALLSSKNRRDFLRGQMPFLPLIDAAQALRAHVQYVNFRNGKGVLFLTQFVQEDTLVSNQALAYVYQGITDDGRFYVSATFPVAAPFLPEDFSEDAAAKHGLDYRAGSFTPAFQKRYKSYLAETGRRLEALPLTEFRPALTLFNELILSLRVNE